MSALYWGSLKLNLDTINMPPAEKNFVEESLIPSQKQNFVSAETKAFLINNTLQLDYYPILFNSEQVSSLSGMPYVRDVDYSVDWVSGLITRLDTSSIGAEETVSISYTYINNEPSTTISSYGRKRRKVTVEGWANFDDWESMETDYAQNIAKAVTLPTGTILNMYISRIPRAIRNRGLDIIYFTIEFMEA